MPLGDRFDDAVALATDLHRHQLRKGTDIPYVSHLLGVCSLVLAAGGSEDEAVAAVLHDAVEDQGGEKTLRIIRERFGHDVAAIVEACSDTTEDRKPPAMERKLSYLAELDQDSTSRSVLLVSAADKLHNLRSIVLDHQAVGDDLWGRFHLSPAEQLWYYRSLADVFSRRLPGVIADQLAELVPQLGAIVEPENWLRWAHFSGIPDCAFPGLGDPDALRGVKLSPFSRAGWLQKHDANGVGMILGICENDLQPVELGVAGPLAVAARLEFVTDVDELAEQGNGRWVATGAIRCQRLVAADSKRPDDPVYRVDLPLVGGNYLAERFLTDGDAVGIRVRRM
jgi:hypothetical protein